VRQRPNTAAPGDKLSYRPDQAEEACGLVEKPVDGKGVFMM
jgi:hypothetical protein